jgi:hypothetical protein
MANMAQSARYGSSAAVAPAPDAGSAHNGVFRKEGEFWTVGYDSRTLRLKDTKGLAYLAHLLRHPAAEFHVLDLAGGIAGQRDDDETSQAAHRLPHGDEDLEKPGSISAVWVMRARWSTNKPRSLIDAGSPSCGKNSKKPRGWGRSSAPSRRKTRSTH